MSQEEERDVNEEINQIMTSRKLEVTEERLQPQSKKSGLFIPAIVVVSLFVLSSVFAGVTYAVFAEDRRAQVTQSQQSSSSQLVREILYQFNTRLSEKEQEVDNIKEQLAEVASSLDRLESDVQGELDLRQRELEQELAETFSRREQELLAQQISPEEIERLLEEERNNAKREIDRELSQIREEAEARVSQRADELRQIQAGLSTTLSLREEEIGGLQGQIGEQAQLLEQQKSQLLLSQREQAALRQQLEEASGLEEGYQALLREQERKRVLESQITGGIISAITEITFGSAGIDLEPLRAILRDGETTRLLGTDRIDADLRVLDMINTYAVLQGELEAQREIAQSATGINAEDTQRLQTLREDYLVLQGQLSEQTQLFEQQESQLLLSQQEQAALRQQLEEVAGSEENYQALLREQEQKYAVLQGELEAQREIAQSATGIRTEDTQRLQTLREDYLLSVDSVREVAGSADIEILTEARNQLLETIMVSTDIFPDFESLFFSLDNRIFADVGQLPGVQEQELAEKTRQEAFFDAEQVVSAALGSTREQAQVQPLLRREQRLARLYSFVGNSLGDNSTNLELQQNYDQLFTDWRQQEQELLTTQRQLSVVNTSYEEYRKEVVIELEKGKKSKRTAWIVTGSIGGALLLGLGLTFIGMALTGGDI